MVFRRNRGITTCLAALIFLSSGFAAGQTVRRAYYLPVGCECYNIFGEKNPPSRINYLIRPFANNLPIMIIGNTATPLSGEMTGGFLLPMDRPYSEIQWLGTQCFFLCDGAIYFCEHNGNSHLLVSGDGSISNFTLSDIGIYFTEKDCLFLLPFDEGSDIECLFQADAPIVPLIYQDGCCFFAAGKDIFGIRGQKLIRVYSAESNVSALAIHPNGTIILSTETAVSYITPAFSYGTIVESPAHDLVVIGDTLFITFQDASCSMITNSYLFGSKGTDSSATSNASQKSAENVSGNEFAQEKGFIEEEAIPFALVEEKPRFQGGDANTFSKWVSQNLNYPAEAKLKNETGRVTVQFIVNQDGSVSDVRVLRGVSPSLDEEAVRVVKASPSWTPGKQRGRDVRVSYQFPVIFQLR